MELCDVVDQSGTRTGRIVERGTELAAGAYYLVVHIWIRDETGHYLVQQRAQHLEFAPGVWATTGGYVQSGEESLPAAIREVKEELGLVLSPAQLHHFGRVVKDDVVQDIWLVDGQRETFAALKLGEDVAEAGWASKAELLRRVREGDFFPYSYINELGG